MSSNMPDGQFRPAINRSNTDKNILFVAADVHIFKHIYHQKLWSFDKCFSLSSPGTHIWHSATSATGDQSISTHSPTNRQLTQLDHVAL